MKALLHIKALPTPRQQFSILLVVVYALLLAFSWNAGVSGDEPVHFKQGEYVQQYFKSGKEDHAAINTPVTNLKYYGQVLDNVSYWIAQLTDSKNPYRIRHIMAALCGGSLILFAGLISVSLSGYRMGMITVILLLFSPRLIGHSLNNLKDIPFALGYVMALWGLIRSVQFYPRLRVGPLIGICMGFFLAFGTRAGGLLLIPILLFFGCIGWFWKQGWLTGLSLKSIRQGSIWYLLLILCLIAGYFLGLLYWPYGLLKPLAHPIESLQVMSHYSVSIRQVFEGKWYWSENLPGIYPLKMMLLTSPILIFIAYIVHFIFIRRQNYWPILLLNFCFLFPLAWVIIQDANLYGGWRHLLFIYSPLVILASWALDQLYQRKEKLARFLIPLLLIVGLVKPVIHVFQNHPLQYLYFNQLAGKKADLNGKYELDYYFHSLGPASHWLKSMLEDKGIDRKIVLASNFDIRPYFPDTSHFETHYIHYYNRGKIQWDYGLFVGNYLYPKQLQANNWPPQNSIHEVCVSGVCIATVIQRNTWEDYRGYLSYKNSQFRESINQLEAALLEDPANETARLYLGWAYRQVELFEQSDSVGLALTLHIPGYDTALDLLGRNQASRGNFEEALAYFEQIISNNHKFKPAYEQAAIVLDSLNRPERAAKFRTILNKN